MARVDRHAHEEQLSNHLELLETDQEADEGNVPLYYVQLNGIVLFTSETLRKAFRDFELVSKALQKNYTPLIKD